MNAHRLSVTAGATEASQTVRLSDGAAGSPGKGGGVSWNRLLGDDYTGAINADELHVGQTLHRRPESTTWRVDVIRCDATTPMVFV